MTEVYKTKSNDTHMEKNYTVHMKHNAFLPCGRPKGIVVIQATVRLSVRPSARYTWFYSTFSNAKV